ncbi:MAG TPA: bacteriocin family protein [Firmicutes bacterium]|nr:bacteriocin family protein [Bacillota bacterium]
MADYLAREAAPLSEEQWAGLDKAVAEAAKSFLVGRRFLSLFGPLGPGLELVPLEEPTGLTDAAVGTAVEEAGAAVTAGQRRYLSLPLLAKDFRLDWRVLEQERRLELPFDTARAALAAQAVARAEDELIFQGRADLGLTGIFTAPGRLTAELGDWSAAGAGYASVVAALEKFLAAGVYGPYALVASPRLYAELNRVEKDTNLLTLDLVQRLATAGVFTSPVLAPNQAALIAVGAENLDLVVGFDLAVAYLETRNLSHYFRVLESVALRVKRPQAICTLE